jgi:DNA-binding NarL/FixJ family response regulator
MTTAPNADARSRVFIVEDHPVFREGLVQILNAEPGLEICGQAGNAEQALQAIPSVKPALVLVDLTLPGKSGLELLRELRALLPGLKLLVVSMHDEALYADRVLRAGGDGYIMKQEDPEEIVRAIQDVLAGHIYVSEAVLASRSKPAAPKVGVERAYGVEHLTDAQLSLLQLLGNGKTRDEIGRQLNLSVRTVASRCLQLRKHLHLKSGNELIRYAVCWVENGA